LALFVPYLIDRGRRSLGSHTKGIVLTAIIGLVALAWLADVAVLAVFAPILIVGWLVLATRRNADATKTPTTTGSSGRQPAESDGRERNNSLAPVGFETVLVVAGTGLVFLVEFVYVH